MVDSNDVLRRPLSPFFPCSPLLSFLIFFLFLSLSFLFPFLFLSFLSFSFFFFLFSSKTFKTAIPSILTMHPNPLPLSPSVHLCRESPTFRPPVSKTPIPHQHNIHSVNSRRP